MYKTNAMIRFTYMLFALLLTGSLSAQTATDPICQNNACSEAINAIRLNAPVLPGANGYDAARTAEFETAYRAFKQVRDGHLADAEWQGKYRRFELSGANCLRYYDLESRIAHEYEKNPDFKAFIDKQESDIASFQKAGFDSSRRRINLTSRFKRECPKQQRNAEKEGVTSEDESKAVYDKLGQVQGYWDENGNILKQLEAIPEKKEEPQRRMSKKEQVEQLTQTVNALPIGQKTKDQISDLTETVNELGPKAKSLTDRLASTADKISSLLPKPGGILDKVGSLLGLKKPLSSYIPQIGGTNIVDKIKGFFGKGKKLKEKAEALKKKAEQLKDELQDTVEKVKSTGKDITDKGDEVKDLVSKLEDLKSKRDALNAKLADKPKKILDELTQEVDDIKRKSESLVEQIKKGFDDSGKLKDELDKLEEKKDAIEDKIEDVEDEIDELEAEEDELEQEGQELEAEVEQLKKQEDLKQQVEDLEPTDEYAKRAAECEEELKGLLGGLTKVTEKKEKVRKGLGKLLSLPGKILGKVTGFIEKHTVLKTLLSAIPGVSNVMNVVEGLFGKSKLLAGALELITGKQGKLTETLDGIAGRVDKVKKLYEEKVAAVDKIKDKVTGFAEEKTGLLEALSKKVDNLSPVEQQVIDLVKKHKLLGEDSACNDLEPVKEELEEVDEELDEIEPQIKEMEEELEEMEAEAEEVEVKTEEVEEQVKEITEQAEEVKAEEEAIKEEFGQEMDLEAVTVEEWSESFEIERPYWEATFHPDDEVVEGYKGRYFQVQLKDANQAIKLLFGPGEYFTSKSDFRDKYGSVIGAFVTEALAAIKKGDRDGVKLFVQGSADISGAKSFRGNLDESFYYDDLNLLPLKGSENFGGSEESRTVKERGFTNDDLPNLRGQFMKEMISVYSKKLQPILLEGSVKKEVDVEDRNAVIYLFLPDSILEE
jgi:uncharacterized coiled-coil DUF342 family protein